MTVETETSRVSYTGSGTTGPFSVPFYFLADEDLVVIKVTIADGTEEVLTLTTDYTLTGEGDEAGGALTLVSSLSSSYRLVIYRDPDDLQETAYPRNDPFPAASHERAIDLRTMVSQRLASLLSRSLRQPDGDSANIDKLPAKVARASMYLAFDADGDPIASSGTGTDTGLREDLADSTLGAALLSFLPVGTGAQARTVRSKLRDVVSVLDFIPPNLHAGIVAGTTTDDLAPYITAADLALSVLGGGSLFFPQGYYDIDTPITKNGYVNWLGVGSHLGSVIRGGHAGDLVTCATTLEHCEIAGMAFKGAGCVAIHGTTQAYMNSLHIHDCHFYADLLRCIQGNLILCDIGPQNTFGYFGTAGASHSHIVSVATAGDTTNINRIFGNRFRNAVGAGVGVYFDRGFHLVVEGNDFEGNSVCPLSILGMYISEVRGNWFENNAFTRYIEYSNSSSGANPNLVNVVEKNHFAAHASMTELINYSGAGAVTFQFNTGTGFAGKTITNSADGFLARSKGNSLSGSTSVDNFDTFTTVTTDGVQFPATQVPSADPNKLDDYQEGSFTGDYTGFSVAKTAAFKYTKIGRQVNLTVHADVSGTSNDTTKTITGMPAEAWPSDTVRGTFVGKDNGGSYFVGNMVISAAGVITLYNTPGFGAWTGSGACEVLAFQVTYTG